MICAGKFLSKYMIYLLKIFLNTKVEFKGLENLKKHKDILLLQPISLCLKHLPCKQSCLVQFLYLKKELIKIPVFGSCLKKIGAIDIVRETATKENLKFLIKFWKKQIKRTGHY